RPSFSSRANPASATAQPATVASSVRFSPLLSVQVTLILSPAFAPWTLNCRYGFFEIAGPQCTFRTGLPFSVAVTSEMYQAGITLPDASLRWPVSISCAISTRTSAAPSFIVARIFIWSAICVVSGFVGLPDRDTGSTAATADGHLDLFPGHVELAVGLHQRHDVRTLAHLDAHADLGICPFEDVVSAGQRVGVLLDQQRHHLCLRQLALDPDRDHRAVLGDVGRHDEHVLRFGRTVRAHRL